MTDDEAMLDQLFAGGAEMGTLMRSHDWSQTSLGLPAHWSQSLKTALRIVLTSRQPMFVWWGEDLINLYNDAYSSFLQNKHPAALGLPASRVWPELWDQLEPRIESAIRKNEGTFDEALLFIMLRKGYLEETYVTFSYSPIPDDGGTGGIFCACTDDTQRIVGERQLALLQELAARTADARTFDEVCTLSASCLETNPYDLPFAMIYLIEPEQQQIVLAGTSSIDRDHPAVPQAVAFDADSVWQLADVFRTQKACLITDLEALFNNLPTGVWQQMPHQAVSIPIAASGQTGKAGILVVGLNPFRLFDGNYRGFIDLVAGQISASIANAEAYEAERKRAEALAELDRAKTVFFSNVSHEFRTPLTLMLGPLEDALASLEEQGSGGVEEWRSGEVEETASPYLPAYSPTLKHQLQVAHRNAQRLLKLVNTLLDFARIEAGRIEAVYEPTDLAMLTTDLAGVFRSAIERAGLRLQVDCPPLPQLVYVDRQMWEKIVLNLLSNAFKFTFEGEIVVSLRWEERKMLQTSSHVILEVRDTGTGIPAEELPHIFQRFHRVKGAAGRSYEGSGIGLSLVQELVKLHGGSIRVGSVVGEGTCFTIPIPTGYSHLPGVRVASPQENRLQLQHGEAQLLNAERSFASIETRATPYIAEVLRWLPDERSEQVDEWMSEAKHHPSTRPPIYPSTLARPARILLADDNADMRHYMRRLLNQQYEVEVVSDGVAALAAIRQQMPDLVLTDVMMPRLDGFGLLQALRANPDTHQIPIILLSALAGEESRIEGLAAGADDYLIKPFSARELLARVEATLKMARMRQEAAQQERELRLISEAAQQQAEDAYNRINQLLESMTDAFTALDRDWRIIHQNAAAQRINGKPLTEVLGKTHWEEWPASVGSQLEHQYRQAMAEQIPVHFEHHYYLLPSFDIWLEIHAYPSEEGLGIFYRDITAHKQSEEALRVAHQRLTYHVMNSPLAVMEFDSELRVVQWSPQAENVFGWKSQEVLGKRLIDMGFVHAEDEAAARREVIELLVNGDKQSKTMYNRNYTKDGSVVYCEWYNSVLRNEAGELISILSLALDVTDRKRAEIALQESEAKFRAAFDQMYQFVGLLTPDGMLLETNQNPLTFADVEHEAVIGKPFWEFPSWNATAELQEIAKTLVAQAAAGQLFHQEVNLFDASSNLHTFDVSAKPVYAIETDQILWVIVEGRDISAQVRLQNALRQEQERSLQLITSSVDGIVAFDANGCCTLWNPAMEQMTGLRQEDVMGRRGVDVFAVLLDAKTLQGFHPGIEKTVTAFEFHFTHPKTRQRQWIEARYSPLNGGSETHNGGLLIVRDVTQQRELERMKREFISIISHEIRTPLSSIRGALGLVATGVLDDDPQTAKEMLGIANNNIERLVRLVNDVLALNRLESRQVELKKQWCEAATLVQQAFSSVQNLAEANQVDLRSSTGNIQVWADPDWLVQVLVNLINNAVKFSPAGTTVSVNVEPQPQQVLFRVTDQGRGIPSEKLETIFGQFQQVNMSDSRQKGGTGLGLSICRLIVQRHGGRIWAESELGRGSKFYFTLPIPD
ncbi:ATP-binding protein [Nostoc sp. FACHB-145]|uniref:ATP-binding protein n=1 Tax=Nostoc sp. FACHB-145 TaxID=2692836 RepID=UPI0016852F8F|nr:ATP-binding protein [Nostoc sp. FACHB-145]MBD2472923.1 PAS domain S-box protein [Nostoc sp. FACHB-145]